MTEIKARERERRRLLFALRYVVKGRGGKKKKRYEQSQGAEGPPTACSLLFQGGLLGYHTTALIHPACLPQEQHRSLEEKLEPEHACG